jgi:hypothetical protein
LKDEIKRIREEREGGVKTYPGTRGFGRGDEEGDS